MTIEEFFTDCTAHGWDAAVFVDYPNCWSISVNEWSPFAPGPEPRRRYARGKTWAEALTAWQQTGWDDREIHKARLFREIQEMTL